MAALVRAAGGEYVTECPIRNIANLLVIADPKDTIEVWVRTCYNWRMR
jgi:hypothetical protein